MGEILIQHADQVNGYHVIPTHIRHLLSTQIEKSSINFDHDPTPSTLKPRISFYSVENERLHCIFRIIAVYMHKPIGCTLLDSCICAFRIHN
jgi:hypothetical protein